VAKAYCSDAYREVANRGVQVHGGIGFTWEHDLQLYYKRAKSSETLFGDANFHRERVAEFYVDRAEAKKVKSASNSSAAPFLRYRRSIKMNVNQLFDLSAKLQLSRAGRAGSGRKWRKVWRKRSRCNDLRPARRMAR
jgi:hypothetical protein